MRYTLEPVHEDYELLSDKPLGTLRNAIWQFPFRNLEEVIRKMDRYSSLAQRLSRAAVRRSASAIAEIKRQPAKAQAEVFAPSGERGAVGR